MLKWNTKQDVTDCVTRETQVTFKAMPWTAYTHEEKSRESRNKLWHHDPRMSAMSLPTTSPHIRVKVGITSRPVTTLEDRRESLWNACVGEGVLPTAQWTSSVYNMWRKPTNGSEIIPWCQKKRRKRRVCVLEGWRKTVRQCVLMHTSGWVSSSTEET